MVRVRDADGTSLMGGVGSDQAAEVSCRRTCGNCVDGGVENVRAGENRSAKKDIRGSERLEVGRAAGY